jgi:trehalose 6-phosphate phosphatase
VSDLLKALKEALTLYKEDPKKTAIFSDLDGTLCEIAPTPDLAAMEQSMKRSLAEVVRLYGVVAIITGRDSRNAKKMVGIEDILYAGNHGLEYLEGEKHFYFDGMEKHVAKIDEAYTDLTGFQFVDGVTIEKKYLGIAIHYREVVNKEQAKTELEEKAKSVALSKRLKIGYGRSVIELKPDVKQDKGSAIRELCRLKNMKRVMYAGDDITDLDGFRELKRMREDGLDTLSLAVASKEIDDSVLNDADYIIKSVKEMERVIEFLSEV